MSEINETNTPPTQAEMDDALNPDVFSGSQRKALKKMDEKNVDADDLSEALKGALTAYENAKNGLTTTDNGDA